MCNECGRSRLSQIDLGRLADQPVVCGLDSQGHIPTIERMIAEGFEWDAIGREIGWDPETAREHYGNWLVADYERRCQVALEDLNRRLARRHLWTWIHASVIALSTVLFFVGLVRLMLRG